MLSYLSALKSNLDEKIGLRLLVMLEDNFKAKTTQLFKACQEGSAHDIRNVKVLLNDLRKDHSSMCRWLLLGIALILINMGLCDMTQGAFLFTLAYSFFTYFHPIAFISPFWALHLVEENGITLLNLASSRGHTEIIALLLNGFCEADIDILDALKYDDCQGMTALLNASQKGYTEIVQLLINALHSANADIALSLNHANNDGNTALMFASQKGYTEIVQLLLNALHTAGADILTAINHRSNNGMTSLRAASQKDHRKIVKMLLAHGANLANANTMRIASLIASASRPTIAAEKLHVILQNGDLAWVDEDYTNFDNKSRTEQVPLNTLASWGIIVGNESFVAKMISCKRENLSSVECTEYLRLALQAQKFTVAQTLLEYQPKNIADSTTHRQIILNYLLHLVVIEKGALSAIIFLLEQGAAPDNIIREENALMAHSLFEQHVKYQIDRILACISGACAQKISQDSKTLQCIAKHLATEIQNQGPSSHDGIQLEDICSRVNAYSNKQSLFHRLCIDNRPDVLAAIGRNVRNRN